jgi:hypothetical protein
VTVDPQLHGSPPEGVRLMKMGEPGAERVVAPAGDGVWRRMPWPVAAEVFDLPAATNPRAVLVIGDDHSIAAGLRGNDLNVATAAELTLDALSAAAVVVMIGGHGALPAQAPAALAARRVLVADATETTFGLQSGIEFFQSQHAGEAIERATMACLHPDAVRPVRVMGFRAARDHRAPVIYPRLAEEIR